MPELTPSEMAHRSGVAVSALHFYEREGLITSRRTSGNQRRYARETLRRVAFIRMSQRLGIPLARIRDALATLPTNRVPTSKDWSRLSAGWRGDIDEALQPPDVSAQLIAQMAPLVATLPAGYRIETAAALEEAGKANTALAAVFPLMLILMMIVIIFQVRSMSAMLMVLLTAPLALVGVVPTLILFHQPFGFNAILGVIGLAGIIMRNTLILIGQIHFNAHQGLSAYDAVVEATVQRARPVILTALAAVLAFIPLTLSVFWGSMAYTLIGGTIVGTVLTLVFLPALYAAWFKVKREPVREMREPAITAEHVQ